MASGKRIFRRFFAIYAIFLICVLLLSVPIYQRTLKEIENRTLETMSAKLAAGVKQLEDSFQIVSIVARTLYEDQRIFSLFHLSSPYAPSDAYRIKEGLNEFKNMTFSIPLIKDSGLFMRNNALIASRLYYESAQNAYEQKFIYSPSAQTWDEWVEQLGMKGRSYALSAMQISTTAATQISPAVSPRPALIFSLPLPLNSSSSNAFFYAVYNEADLLDLLLLPSYESACRLILTDANGRELISYQPINPKETVAVAQQGSHYLFNVSVEIDTAVFSREMSYFHTFIVIGVLIYLAVAMVLAVAFSWRNARPVIGMIQAAEKKGKEAGVSVSDDPTAPYKDSYEYIRALIDQMGTEVVQSKTTLSEQITYLRESTFERLLQDDVHWEEGQMYAEKYFPQFPACCRMILIKTISEGDRDVSVLSAAQVRLLDFLQQALPPQAMVHALPNQAFNQTVVLLPCRMDSPRNQCEALFNALNEELGEIITLKFAVSPPFEGMDKLSSIFKQLRHLLRLSGNQGENVLYSLDNPPVQKIPRSTSATRAYECLLRGELDMALALMNQDVNELKALGLVQDIEVQQLFFVYRHALSLARSEIPGAGTLPPPPDYPAQLPIDGVFQPLTDYCRDLFQLLSAQRQNNEENFERKILRFIQDRLQDPALCIRMVTDEFSISESNLRRILLKSTETTFQDYVEAQRLALAQQLLTASDMPVGQIPSLCGYASSNSFYKAFRRRFNLTPTAMREEARINKKENK